MMFNGCLNDLDILVFFIHHEWVWKLVSPAVLEEECKGVTGKYMEGLSRALQAYWFHTKRKLTESDLVYLECTRKLILTLYEVQK